MGKTLFLLAAAAGLYLLALALLFVFQRALIYPVPAGRPDLARALPDYEAVRLETGEGLRLIAAHRASRDDRPTLVFFHGNGDSLAGAEVATRRLAAAGYGLLLVEYRGYGGNPGKPNEAGLYRDGRAALEWLGDQGVPPHRLVLIGNSLGAGVATQLATEQPVAGLVIISGFVSLPEIAARHFRLFPARLLLSDRYDNEAKLPRVDAPLLVLHGTADTLIPPDHGVRLARAARRATLRLVPDAGHELAYLPASQEEILRWLNRIP